MAPETSYILLELSIEHLPGPQKLFKPRSFRKFRKIARCSTRRVPIYNRIPYTKCTGYRLVFTVELSLGHVWRSRMIETCHDLSVNVANDRNFQHKKDSNHPGAVCREARSDPDALPALRAPQTHDFPPQIPVLPGWREAPGQQSREGL